jgi:hypothetical protein
VIQLSCANCKATLEVDDAFAGGVCRCQHCGTIQTVPKPGARPRVPGAPVPQTVGGGDEQRALYQVKSRTGTSSAPSGLEELAEVVHSSGLSGSGLLNRSNRQIASYAPVAATSNKNSMMMLVIGGVVLLLVILGAAGWFIVGTGKSVAGSGASGTGATGTGTPGPVVDAKPNFAGIDLTSNKIAYLIDRGDATAAYFESLKGVTSRSVLSLGSDRRFEVILWNNGSDDAYPRSGLAYGTADDVKKLNAWFDDVSTGRSTTPDPGLKTAIKDGVEEIVLVTAKSDQLVPEDFILSVMKIRGSSKVKIHTVTIGTSPPTDPLRKIALETGGKFANLKPMELRDLARE